LTAVILAVPSATDDVQLTPETPAATPAAAPATPAVTEGVTSSAANSLADWGVSGMTIAAQLSQVKQLEANTTKFVNDKTHELNLRQSELKAASADYDKSTKMVEASETELKKLSARLQAERAAKLSATQKKEVATKAIQALEESIAAQKKSLEEQGNVIEQLKAQRLNELKTAAAASQKEAADAAQAAKAKMDAAAQAAAEAAEAEDARAKRAQNKRASRK
jgi:colicin import membrane protein